MHPPRDTSSEAWAVQVETWQRMGTAGRGRASLDMSDFARQTALQGIRRRHPDYDDEQARRALLRLLYGDALTAAAYPGMPLLEP